MLLRLGEDGLLTGLMVPILPRCLKLLSDNFKSDMRLCKTLTGICLGGKEKS
jgi:hypothetical protein